MLFRLFLERAGCQPTRKKVKQEFLIKDIIKSELHDCKCKDAVKRSHLPELFTQRGMSEFVARPWSNACIATPKPLQCPSRLNYEQKITTNTGYNSHHTVDRHCRFTLGSASRSARDLSRGGALPKRAGTTTGNSFYFLSIVYC